MPESIKPMRKCAASVSVMPPKVMRWGGRLIARILPLTWSEYDVKKPGTRMGIPIPMSFGIPLSRRILDFQARSPKHTSSISVGDWNNNGSSCQSSEDDDSLHSSDDNSSFDIFSPNRESLDDIFSLNDFDLFDDDSLIVHLDLTLFPLTCPSPEVSLDDHENFVIRLHMNRGAYEEAARTIRRLELNTSRKLKEAIFMPRTLQRKRSKHKQPKKSDFEEGDERKTVLKLSEEGDDNDCKVVELDYSKVTNAELWRRAATLLSDDRKKIEINMSIPSGEINLELISCPPSVLDVRTFESFEHEVFCGVPLVVETDLIFADRAIYTWYVNEKEVLSGYVNNYTPENADIGKKIMVKITPIRQGHNGNGCEELYQFTNPVKLLPYMPIVSPLRDEFRQSKHPNDVRVLTYNLLADLYASREIDHRWFYAHCSLEHLVRKRRMPMLMAEILAHDADIVCLQEVDGNIFDSLIHPVLKAKGYQGYYSNKASSQREGCAMLWKTSSFSLEQEDDMQSFAVRDLFEEEVCDGWDSIENINKLMESHDELRMVTKEKVGQVLQVATLTVNKQHCDSSVNHLPDKIVLANTHLFYHPMADHIRAMQTYAICKKLDQVRRRQGSPHPLILSGDLNSNIRSGAVHLLFNRTLAPEDRRCWVHLNRYEWESGAESWCEDGTTPPEPDFDESSSEEESLPDSTDGIINIPTITLPPSFPNLVLGCPEMPDFTNYAKGFVETLDYIFVSEPSREDRFGFVPRKSAPMPSREFVSRYVAMPNEFMPSDHVSVVCDLKWGFCETLENPN